MLGDKTSIDVNLHASGTSVVFIVVVIIINLISPFLIPSVCFALAVGVVFRTARRPAVVGSMRGWPGASRGATWFALLSLLWFVWFAKERDIRRRGLHGLNDRLLLSGANDVNELISCDRVVRYMCHILFEVVRKARANEDSDVGVWQALAAKFSE